MARKAARKRRSIDRSIVRELASAWKRTLDAVKLAHANGADRYDFGYFDIAGTRGHCSDGSASEPVEFLVDSSGDLFGDICGYPRAQAKRVEGFARTISASGFLAAFSVPDYVSVG